MDDRELFQRMTSIGGEYQGRRLHQIRELPDGTYEANVMEGMQLVGDFGYDKLVYVAVKKALLASGCTF